MSEREKTYVEDVNRSIYDIRNEEKDVYRIQKGLTPAIAVTGFVSWPVCVIFLAVAAASLGTLHKQKNIF